jgi:hypothetical protein
MFGPQPSVRQNGHLAAPIKIIHFSGCGLKAIP